MSKDPMYQCPSFQSCTAPVCPLESVFPSKLRFRLPGEAKCKARKSVRLRLGASLKYLGLFKAEFFWHTPSSESAVVSDNPEGKIIENENKGTLTEVFNG